MTNSNKFHLSSSAAETYENQTMPAIFAPMAEATLDAISLPGQAKVLDVACGTGAVARAIALRLSGPSRIVGADLNPAMIEIAQRNIPTGKHKFEFVAAPVEEMPFENGEFDVAFCQQGLQFFPDKQAALVEMRRVMCDGAKLFLTCWASIPPFFQIVAEALAHHLDDDCAAKAVEPFIWNDSAHICSLISDAQFECPPPTALALNRIMSASPETMRAGILASPNEPALRKAGDEVIGKIVSEILEGVARFRDGDTLKMPQQAHLFQAIAK